MMCRVALSFSHATVTGASYYSCILAYLLYAIDLYLAVSVVALIPDYATPKCDCGAFDGTLSVLETMGWMQLIGGWIC